MKLLLIAENGVEYRVSDYYVLKIITILADSVHVTSNSYCKSYCMWFEGL